MTEQPFQAAYEKTAYWVEDRFALRCGERSAALDDLLAGAGHDHWAFVTACNPLSIRLDDTANAARMAALEARVRAIGHRSLHGRGVGDDGDWPPESSLLVLGINEPDAIALAGEFRQAAIIVGRRGAAARLVDCRSVGCAPDTIHLADGGQLLVAPGFLPADAADRALCELRDRCAWEQRPALFGHPQPRLTAAHGDAGLTYRYSSTVHQAAPWTATLQALKAAIEGVMGRYNFCLLNRYRSGADSMGLHADDEPEMGDTIGSLSLGATRTFRIRHNVTRESRAFPIEHGTLIIMAGSMQRFWKHEIPKTARPVGERINLTFREIRPVELAPRPATPD